MNDYDKLTREAAICEPEAAPTRRVEEDVIDETARRAVEEGVKWAPDQ